MSSVIKLCLIVAIPYIVETCMWNVLVTILRTKSDWSGQASQQLLEYVNCSMPFRYYSFQRVYVIRTYNRIDFNVINVFASVFRCCGYSSSMRRNGESGISQTPASRRLATSQTSSAISKRRRNTSRSIAALALTTSSQIPCSRSSGIW